ncbi:MAG TPA: alpha/beta hydrolase [Roseiflexaceae bacterium]|nr:alpha/beta hydrolase [Roseiflexaceae bacterium]
MAEGGNSTLLLLHPGGVLHSVWLPLMRELAPRCRVLAPDLSWQGPGSEALRALAEGLAPLLRTEAAGPALVAGGSLGANVALHLALIAPELVAGLVLDSAQAGGPPGQQLRMLRALQLVTAPVPTRLYVAGVLRQYGSYSPEDRAAVRAEVERLGKQGFLAQIAAHTDHDVRADLQRIRAPTHLLAGERDPLTRSGQPQILHGGIVGSTLEIVPDAGHVTFLANPVPFRRAVERMLK